MPNLKKVDVGLDGIVKLNDKVISAKPIGYPRIVSAHVGIDETETSEAEIEKLARNYVEANAYCKGFRGNIDEYGSVYIPVQFYKI